MFIALQTQIETIRVANADEFEQIADILDANADELFFPFLFQPIQQQNQQKLVTQ